MLTNSSLFCQFPTEHLLCFLPAETDCEDVVFFDIETTGLSSRTSRLYLIGASIFRTGQWVFSQFLAENEAAGEEKAVLEAFSSFIGNRNCFIHFNGSSFDIPYLQKKYRDYNLPSPFRSMHSVDLYTFFRPFAPLLKAENARQKSFEPYAGYRRKDTMTGKELIKIYHNYTKGHEKALHSLLICHNHDDVEGMVSLLRLAGLHLLFQGIFQIQSHETVTKRCENGELAEEILFHLHLPVPLPVPLSIRFSSVYIVLEEYSAKIKVPLFEGTLKYFYPDYKNYYYLPEEDEAVHKSVGIYVDSENRQKATSRNCYKHVCGYFLEAPGKPDLPLMREFYNSDCQYIQWTDSFAENPVSQKSFLSELLKYIFKNCGKKQASSVSPRHRQ